MSEPNEQEPDEAAETPADEPGQSDDETAEEEAEAAETDAQEPAEASAPKSDKDVERANKALEKEATAHANRISKIMGEDAQALIPCELCWPLTPGFHWPADAMPLDDEQKVAVLAAIGEGPGAGPPLQDAKGVSECPTCLGYGRLKYPTRNPHVLEQQCPKCAGQGYVTTETQQENVYSFTQSQGGTTATSGTGTTATYPDSWGRPVGHPHYGIAPANVGT